MTLTKPKFRYFMIDDYGNVVGTDDSNIARQVFFDGGIVIDCLTGESFEEPDESTTGDIRFEPIERAEES